MKIKYSSIIPFKGFYSTNLFGTLYIRKEYKNRPIDEKTITHETIHALQAKDFCRVQFIGYIIFYILYFIFWIIELIRPPYNKAYRDNCFEKEAYYNDSNPAYLDIRPKFAEFKKDYWINH